MNVFIVYCHPSEDSYTFKLKNEFIKGLNAAGHSYVISDLYKMGFNAEFTEKDYLREAYYRNEIPLDDDVLIEQNKIQESDAIVFIYPVFWTEAPAKLIGWFDRVWTCGFAYGVNPSMKQLKKALFIAIAGRSIEDLNKLKQAQAMETVMVDDRINNRAKEKQIVFLDDTSRYNMNLRNIKGKKHLETVYNFGKEF
ncbi:NAD(P)H-dependent oxidoreductase [Clostridium sp.]